MTLVKELPKTILVLRIGVFELQRHFIFRQKQQMKHLK